MEKLATAIKLAAKYREESFDNCNCQYTLPMWDAANKAASDVGYDMRETHIIYMLLVNSWNESLAWAESFK